MATGYRKARDTEPIKATLRNKGGAAINLTGTTVRLFATPALEGIGVALDAPCTIVGDPLDGKTSCPVLATDLPKAVYRVVWEITFQDGTVKTVPTRGYETIVVEDDLG